MKKFLYVLMFLAFVAALCSGGLRSAIVRTLDVDGWVALILSPCLAVLPFYGFKLALGEERLHPDGFLETALDVARDAGLDAPQRVYYAGLALLVAFFDLFLLWRAVTGR